MLRPDPHHGRKKDFKKGIDAEEARRKREDNIIELRKNKRDENLQKKRQTQIAPQQQQYAQEDSNRAMAPGAQIQQRVRGRRVRVFCFDLCTSCLRGGRDRNDVVVLLDNV